MGPDPRTWAHATLGSRFGLPDGPDVSPPPGPDASLRLVPDGPPTTESVPTPGLVDGHSDAGCDGPLDGVGPLDTELLELDVAPSSPSILISSFVERITAPIPSPLLKTPYLRAPRHRVQFEHLRQSGRLAMKSRGRLHMPELQAERVLMKKLGMQSEAEPTDPGSFSQFKAILDGPLSASKREELDALLPDDGYNGPTLFEVAV